MMYLGYRLTKRQIDLEVSLKAAIEETSNTVKIANQAVGRSTEGASEGMAGTMQMEAASPVLGGTSEYVKGLAELAKNLSGLTPAVAAFTIATILFFFAATLAAIDRFTA
jgi:hypothetical protein